MKWLFPFLIFLLIRGLDASAQTNAIKFGFKAGISSVTFDRTPETGILIKESDKAKIGYYAGAFASLNIAQFSLQPEVIFTARGGQTTEEIISGDIVHTMYGSWRLFYIQVPLNLIYNILMENASIYIGAGPYISAALSGKFEPQTIDGNIIQDDPNKLDLSFDAKFGNDPYSNFKRLDYGANAIAGLRLNNGLLFNNGYDMGFANVQSDHYFYSSTKNRSIHFGLGYQF